MRSFVSHGVLLAAGVALGISFALAGATHGTDKGAGPQAIKLADTSKAKQGAEKKSVGAAPKKAGAPFVKYDEIKGEAK